MPGNAAAADPAAHGAEMDSPPEQTVHDQSADRGSAADRRPLANSGQYLLPLILSGVIATIMVVAFVSGFESIFPAPAPPATPATAPAATSDSAETAAPSAGDDAASESNAAPTTTSPAASDTSDAAPADPKTGSKPADSSEKKTSVCRKQYCTASAQPFVLSWSWVANAATTSM